MTVRSPETRVTSCSPAPKESLTKVNDTSPSSSAEAESTWDPSTSRATSASAGKSAPWMVTPDSASSVSVTSCGATEIVGSYTTGSSVSVNEAEADKSPETRVTSCSPAPSESLVKAKDTSPASSADAESTSDPPIVNATSAPAGKSAPVIDTPESANSDTVNSSGATEATGSYTTGSSDTVNEADADRSPEIKVASCSPAPSESLVKVNVTSPSPFAEAESTSDPPIVNATSAPAGKSAPVIVTPESANSDTVNSPGDTDATGSYTTGSSDTVNEADADRSPDTNRT